MTAAEGHPIPSFSVIMIFHNERRFLVDAVKSVAAQTGPSWELILVDDGSTDGSGDIARGLATAFPAWIRCAAHPGGANRGMSASRNLGIELAGGRWITFLDADDIWMPGKLDAQLGLLAANPAVSVLVSPAEWWSSWDRDADRGDRRQVLSSGPDVDSSSESRLVDPPRLVNDFLRDEWQSICDLVIHRDVLHRIGGYETAFTGMFEDQVFHTKVLSRFPALVTRQHWYRYRQHADACTARTHAAREHREARVRFLEWAVGHVERQQQPPTIVDRTAWSDLVNELKRQRRLSRRSVLVSRLARSRLVRPVRSRLGRREP